MTCVNRTALAAISGCAVIFIAGAASAAKPMNDAQKHARIATVAAKSRALPQPRTMADAEATQARLADGSVMVMVPTELWSHLSVIRDADGEALQIVESGQAAPLAAPAKELDHD